MTSQESLWYHAIRAAEHALQAPAPLDDSPGHFSNVNLCAVLDLIADGAATSAAGRGGLNTKYRARLLDVLERLRNHWTPLNTTTPRELLPG